MRCRFLKKLKRVLPYHQVSFFKMLILIDFILNFNVIVSDSEAGSSMGCEEVCKTKSESYLCCWWCYLFIFHYLGWPVVNWFQCMVCEETCKTKSESIGPVLWRQSPKITPWRCPFPQKCHQIKLNEDLGLFAKISRKLLEFQKFGLLKKLEISPEDPQQVIIFTKFMWNEFLTGNGKYIIFCKNIIQSKLSVMSDDRNYPVAVLKSILTRWRNTNSSCVIESRTSKCPIR